jgi:hypothetical protein
MSPPSNSMHKSPESSRVRTPQIARLPSRSIALFLPSTGSGRPNCCPSSSYPSTIWCSAMIRHGQAALNALFSSKANNQSCDSSRFNTSMQKCPNNISRSSASICMMTFPQGLKPKIFCGLCGTTKVVPCYSAFHLSRSETSVGTFTKQSCHRVFRNLSRTLHLKTISVV